MKSLINTKELIYCGLFVAFISVSAFIKIPVPVVPFTLQMLFILLAGQLLRPVSAAFTVFAYILLGLIGLPIFSGGGGIGYVLHPTFGYLLGFLFAAPVISVLSKSKESKYFNLVLKNIFGVLIIYIFGFLYCYLINKLYLGNEISFIYLFIYSVLVFIPSDLVFCFLSASISKRIKKSFNV